MRKIIQYILLLATLPSIMLQAQENNLVLLFNTGISIPSTPDRFSNNWQTGLNGGIGIGYQTSTHSQVIFHFDYYYHKFDKDSYLKKIAKGSSNFGIEGASLSIITASINLRLIPFPSATVAPYLIVGIGYMNISQNNITLSLLNETTTIEFESFGALMAVGGAGVNISISKSLVIFAEANYVEGESLGEDSRSWGKNTVFIPIKLGLIIKL